MEMNGVLARDDVLDRRTLGFAGFGLGLGSHCGIGIAVAVDLGLWST